MKRGLCIILITFFCLHLKAQNTDSTFKKKALIKADVQAFFSSYLQEGKHSAVTGGTGDENLQVYSTGANIGLGINATTIIFNASVDVITSPSTDKINFVKSSPSLHDRHVQSKMGFEHQLKNTKIRVGAAYLFGLESDYFSNGISSWFSLESKKRTRSLSLSLDLFFDDLRWGLLNAQVGRRPIILIYPFELRGTKWFDIHHRNSYNLNVNMRQDVNKKLSLNLSLGAMYQEGLLSTPFHRIYFSDTTRAVVENLPRQRIRLPISLSANWFAQKYLVLQTYYRLYWDNFGIFSHTLNLQAAIKPNNKISIYPFVRGYYQTGSPYFAPYREHLSTQTYYTSDYDYSAFAVVKAGLGVGWYPDAKFGKKSKLYFNSLLLRYSYFYRTDGLSAHILSLVVGIKK